MRVRSVLFLTAVGALLWLAGSAAQQAPAGTTARKAGTWTPPRTPWGDPDLQGIYTNKDENNTPFERPSDLAGTRLSDFGEKDAFNQAVIDAMAALVAVVGPQGVVLSLNQAWSRFSRADIAPEFLRLDVGDDLLTERAASGKASEDLRLLQHGLRAVLHDSRLDQELEISYGATDGDRRWFMIRVERVGRMGVGAVIACIDITDRRRSEETLRESSRPGRRRASAAPPRTTRALALRTGTSTSMPPTPSRGW